MTEETPQQDPAQYHFRKFMEHLGVEFDGSMEDIVQFIEDE